MHTPEELLKAYDEGLMGAPCDPEGLKLLLGELPMPLFGAAAYDLEFSGEGKLSLPFKSVMKYVPNFGDSERQTTGDCVSHGTRNAIDITRAVEIDIKGESEAFIARGATEAIYQSRGHYGQGMSCSAAARYVHKNGGILLRKDYGDVDLSEYNATLGIKHRIPSSIYKTEAQKHQVNTTSLVGSVEEARDALANGYAIACCSGLGFSSTRNSHGVAARKGSWSHAMAWIACDDTHESYKETLFLVQNSWGRWNGGPKKHGQPDGSFWIREKDAYGLGEWI